MNDIFASLLQFTDRLKKATETHEFREFVKKANNVLIQLAEFAEQWKLVSEQEQRNGILYSKNGWFISPYIHMNKLGFNINQDNIDTVLSNEIEEEMGTIEEDVCLHNKHRKHILTDAFSAHRDGKYSLSIPVFLAQADGIAYDIFGISAFSTKPKYRLNDKVSINREMRFFSDIWFSVLVDDESGIRANTKEIDNNTLNRHAVLHGISTNYPTKINSLKAISFLAGINWLMKSNGEYFEKIN